MRSILALVSALVMTASAHAGSVNLLDVLTKTNKFASLSNTKIEDGITSYTLDGTMVRNGKARWCGVMIDTDGKNYSITDISILIAIGGSVSAPLSDYVKQMNNNKTSLNIKLDLDVATLKTQANLKGSTLTVKQTFKEDNFLIGLRKITTDECTIDLNDQND